MLAKKPKNRSQKPQPKDQGPRQQQKRPEEVLFFWGFRSDVRQLSCFGALPIRSISWQA
jgi:hypothetical protein